ncbi:hypothetical protein BpHYR1_018903, partial [Brachionus plicatilis]
NRVVKIEIKKWRSVKLLVKKSNFTNSNRFLNCLEFCCYHSKCQLHHSHSHVQQRIQHLWLLSESRLVLIRFESAPQRVLIQ